ncbi:MAG: nucleoside recognition domain-containing protein [Salibacteraceae bacterium]
MALNYVWVAFFLIAFVVGAIKLLFFGDTAVFGDMVQSTFDMAKVSVDISIYLIGVITLWQGIMKVGEEGGAVRYLTRIVAPFFSKLFPEVPKNHPAIGAMMMNFSANMLGLDNAATPLGLKAMNELQTINPDQEKASNAMIMFIVLNTSGLTVVPVSVMAIRAAQGAVNPADIFLPILLATYFASLGGLIAVAIKQRINLFQPVILAWLGGFTALVAAMLYGFSSLEQSTVAAISNTAGNGIILSIIMAFFVLALFRRINVYETFIEGAKEGFGISIKIIPYLVAMLVGIGVFRASGAMDYMVDALGLFFALFMDDTRFVDALPTALMKPLSGSGARGMMVEQMNTFGADSFVGRLASVFQGSTETTFYTLAVYFGSVSIRKTRYALGAGLIADLCGIIAAIVIAYIFFG